MQWPRPKDCRCFYVGSRVDEEALGTQEFFFLYLEILQAFALMNPHDVDAKPLQADAEQLKADMRELGQLMMRRLLAIPDDLSTDEEIRRFYLRTEMMANDSRK